MTEQGGISRWWAVPGLVVAALLMLLFVWEWLVVGVVADPGMIAQYEFGTEVMIMHRGWHYESAAIYARSALIEALVALFILGVFIRGMVSRSGRIVGIAYLLLVVGIVVNQLVFVVFA